MTSPDNSSILSRSSTPPPLYDRGGFTLLGRELSSLPLGSESFPRQSSMSPRLLHSGIPPRREEYDSFIIPNNIKICGFGSNIIKYSIVEVMINTYFMNIVPLTLQLKSIEDLSKIKLETRYNNTFIKVIDVQENNLNPSVTYSTSYLLSLPSILSDPKIKSFNHDIIFNVYNYLHFLNKNKIDFNYENIIILANVDGLDNAYWNGYYLTFGSGTNDHTPLTCPMIVAHELTHALIQKVCDLEYSGQSGALNESYADIFGVCFEFYIHDKYTQSLGWELGSETGFLLRNMQDPHKCSQPMTIYDSYYCDPNNNFDNGGVHINSGIPNHCFYCIHESIGYKPAFELFVRVLYKLHKTSDFLDFKHNLIKINRYLNIIPNDKLITILDMHIS